MPRRKEVLITCPKCGRKKDLSLLITVTAASVRLPVVDGKPAPAFELLHERPFAGDETLLRYSDADTETRVILYADDAEILINCPQCEAVYPMPRGMNARCNAAE